jgi:hypothetical protein
MPTGVVTRHRALYRGHDLTPANHQTDPFFCQSTAAEHRIGDLAHSHSAQDMQGHVWLNLTRYRHSIRRNAGACSKGQTTIRSPTAVFHASAKPEFPSNSDAHAPDAYCPDCRATMAASRYE